LLRDPQPEVREAAIEGLVQLEAKEAAGAIEQTRRLFSNQAQPWLERQLTSLRKGEGSELQKLKKEVEELTLRVKKLEQKNAEK
jgi:hypothetical protein